MRTDVRHRPRPVTSGIGVLGVCCGLLLGVATACRPSAPLAGTPASATGQRRIEGRLLGQPYRPFAAPPRSPAGSGSEWSDAEGFASPAAAPADPDPVALAGSQLELGRVSAAIALLSAIPESARDARAWTALSAAYLAAWALSADSARPLAAALEAAIAATELDATGAEPWFNLAIIQGYLGLGAEAARSWERWATVEKDAAWRAEGDRMRTRVTPPAPATRAPLSLDLSIADWERAVAEDPQAAREFLQDVLLPQWGTAYGVGDHERAAALLSRASAITTAMTRLNEDAINLRTVQQISADAEANRLGRLARGLAAYGEGRALYEANAWEAAGERFESARDQLRLADSPMAVWATV